MRQSIESLLVDCECSVDEVIKGWENSVKFFLTMVSGNDAETCAIYATKIVSYTRRIAEAKAIEAQNTIKALDSFTF